MPLEELDIPAVAFETKANYPTRPDPMVVREINNFIAMTGTPHLWRDHTHTRPPAGAAIVYLGTFDLPKARHNDP